MKTCDCDELNKAVLKDIAKSFLCDLLDVNIGTMFFLLINKFFIEQKVHIVNFLNNFEVYFKNLKLVVPTQLLTG